MLLIDDILLFPTRSLLFLFREIHNAAQQEFENEAESLRAQLSELYMRLETKQITEKEFDAQEKALLDRLSAMESQEPLAEAEEDAEDQ